MKAYKFLTILVLSIIIIPATTHSYSYGKNHSRIEMAKKKQIINRLKLTDRDAEKFFERYSKWDDKIIEAHIKAETTKEKLREALKHNASDANLKTITAEYVKAVENLENAMQHRNNDIKSILSPRQYAEFVLFDVDFDSKLQSSVIRAYKEKKAEIEKCRKEKKAERKAKKK